VINFALNFGRWGSTYSAHPELHIYISSYNGTVSLFVSVLQHIIFGNHGLKLGQGEKVTTTSLLSLLLVMLAGACQFSSRTSYYTAVLLRVQ